MEALVSSTTLLPKTTPFDWLTAWFCSTDVLLQSDYFNVHDVMLPGFVMIALCNRADHYIFALWFLSFFFFFFLA